MIPGHHRRQVMKRSCASASVFTQRPSWLRSQQRSVLSSETERRYLPPGWNAMARTQLSWPIRVLRQFPRASQSLMVLSREPVAMNSAVLVAADSLIPARGARYWYAVWGANVQHSMTCSWPNIISLFSVFDMTDISHNRAVISSPVEKRKFPSGEGHTSRTQPLWPCIVFTQ